MYSIFYVQDGALPNACFLGPFLHMRGPNNEYNTKAHMDWVDENNQGVSHYGLHPDILPHHLLRFDSFHLHSSITRKIIVVLRRFIRQHTYAIISSFADLLKDHWEPHYIMMWQGNKKMHCLRGKQILAFIRAIPFILAEFLRAKFEKKEYLHSLMESLRLWKQISEFIHI